MAKKLIGSAPNQVPSNADLGTIAYQNTDNVRVDRLAVGESELVDAIGGYPDTAPGLNLDFRHSSSSLNDVYFRRQSSAFVWSNRAGDHDQNLFKWSQKFDESYWDFSRHTPSGGFTAPDGTSTAWKFTQHSANIDSGYIGRLDWRFVPGTYTFSVYAKAGADGGYLRMDSRQGTMKTSYFNLTNGTVSVNNPDQVEKIYPAGNGWYRCSITFTVTAGETTQLLTYFSNTDTINTINANGESGFLWGAQMENTSSPTYYKPTEDLPHSSGRYFLGGDVIPNQPRIDHHPKTGECRGLLIEKQASNYHHYSSKATGAGDDWSYNAMDYVNNAGIAPNGKNDANYFYCILGTRRHETNFRWILPAAGRYTISFYAKQCSDDLRYLSVAPQSGGDAGWSYFDLQEITATYMSASTEGYATAEDVGNGWGRYSITTDYPVEGVGGTYSVYISPGPTVPSGSVYDDVQGNDNGVHHGFLMWGPQVENNEFATSWIETANYQGTREADWCQVRNERIDDAYSGGPLGIKVDVERVHEYSSGTYVNIATDGGSDQLAIDSDPVNIGMEFRSYLIDDTVTDHVTLFADHQEKDGILAITAGDGYWRQVKDGSFDISEDPSFTNQPKNYSLPKSPNTIGIGCRTYTGSTNYYCANAWLKQVVFYKQQLTDKELITLTTEDE
jgi:hypothetical protein